MKTNITLTQFAAISQSTEVIEIVAMIKARRLESEFNSYLATYDGGDNNLLDYMDAVLDFPRSVLIEVCTPASRHTFSGADTDEAMEQLNSWLWQQVKLTPNMWDKIERYTFQIGTITRRVCLTYFHYCYAKGRITVDELLRYSEVVTTANA